MTTSTNPDTFSVSEPSASLRTVTPEMAGTWLANNTANRKLRKDLVSAYARDMLEGRWTLNGEAIQIARTGRLLNGQHRLSAIVEAATNVQMLVVTGLDDHAQDTIDTGVKRVLGDVLGMAGHTNANVLSATANLILLVRNGKNYRASDAEKRALIESDDKLRWVVSNVSSGLPKRLASTTLLTYAYYILHDVDPFDCAEFFTKLNTLENLPEGSPIAALSRRLTAFGRRSTRWSDRTYTLSLIFHAWNAFRQGGNRTMVKAVSTKDGGYVLPTPV